MAIQFPNFLSVPVTAKDYSGIADAASNFYAGYNMPNDALIKEIQAKFAKPNAEAALSSAKLGNEHQSLINKFLPETHRQSMQTSRLSNRKAEMDIQKLAMELAQQKELERQLKMAFTGNGQGGSPASMQGGGGLPPAVRPPIMTPAQIPPVGGMAPNPVSAPPPLLAARPTINMPSSIENTGMQQTAMQSPSQPSSTPEAPHEVVVAKGSPQLAGVDAMYDANPLSRNFLEKKGFKKTQEVKHDSKTGKTTIVTKYPSGKVTVQQGLIDNAKDIMDNNIPLTKPVLNKVVNQIRGTDAVLPYINKILDMGDVEIDKKGNVKSGKNNQLPTFSHLPTDANAAYQATISEALEKYLASSGLNSTDLSTKKTEEILTRHYGESTNAYLKRLVEKKKEMERDRKQNVDMVKKGLKLYGDFSENSGKSAVENASDAELEEAANG